MRVDFNCDWQVSSFGKNNFTAVKLPHDAMQFEKRLSNNPSGSAGAYYGGGRYIYKKDFFVNSDLANKNVLLEFEGVYKNATVLVNSVKVGKNAYGYTQFFVDITKFLNIGKINTIEVTVLNDDMPNSRWYTGSGIYRPVYLHIKNSKHIAVEGVKISTISYNPPKIAVSTENNGGNVEIEIFEANTSIAKAFGDNVELLLDNAKLWSSDYPNLYYCKATLIDNGEIVDEVIERFGIRLVEWNNKGLYINGENTLLRGGCVHSDNGILGACSYEKSEYRKAKILKNAGYNSLRASHNPASKALIQACDELGLYFIDETWDMWYSKKNKFDYANDFLDNYIIDVKSMVSRDFNHPSVIMYSIGNEISEPKTDKGVELAREIVQLIHSLDTNRAVTCGVNLMIIDTAKQGKGIYKEEGGLNSEKKALPESSTAFNMMTQMVGTGMNNAANCESADLATTPLFNELDIAGYNYASGRYKMEGQMHPSRVIYGSETFPQDIYKNWKMVKELPYLVGDFMWTAWDYIGEAGLGAWAYTNDAYSFDKPYPWLLSEAGVFNILGDADGEALFTKVVWGLTDVPQIAVKPVNWANNEVKKAVWRGTNARISWAYKGCDGVVAKVEVYSTGDKVELYLNQKLIDTAIVSECLAEFDVPYCEGELKAVAYGKNGNKLGENKLLSATGKITVRITFEDNKIAVGEIAYVNIDIVGENGVVESNCDRKLTLNVDCGELLAFGSANPRCVEEFVDNVSTTYYGRSQAVVRGIKSGKLVVVVTDENNNQYEADLLVE